MVLYNSFCMFVRPVRFAVLLLLLFFVVDRAAAALLLLLLLLLPSSSSLFFVFFSSSRILSPSSSRLFGLMVVKNVFYHSHDVTPHSTSHHTIITKSKARRVTRTST